VFHIILCSLKNVLKDEIDLHLDVSYDVELSPFIFRYEITRTVFLNLWFLFVFQKVFIYLHTLPTSADWKVTSYKTARETNFSIEFLRSP